MTPILRTFQLGPMQISETDEPGIVEIFVPDGACRLTKEQWQQQLRALTRDYAYHDSDFVRFVDEPEQQALPL